MKNSKILKLCQNIALGKLFLEKKTFSSIRFFFTRAVTESVWGLTGWVSRDKDSELLKNRLKIKEETNSASENLNSKSAN